MQIVLIFSQNISLKNLADNILQQYYKYKIKFPVENEEDVWKDGLR